MKQLVIAIGDLLAIALVTIIGFATHGEVGASFVSRMLVLFLPLTAAWFVLGAALGLFRSDLIAEPRQIWRPVLAMIFAAPAAVVVRGLLLNAPVIPIFGLVLSLTAGLGMLIWRGIALLLLRKKT